MSDTTAALPTYHRQGDVAIVTLDDGKANVISTAVVDALNAHMDRVETEGARALVIVGRPGKFSAGFDLSEMTANVESMRALVVHGARWLMRLYGFGVPTVAACTGHALAAGALTLLSCDVRIGADVPAKIGLNEVAIGMALPKFAVELARERVPAHELGEATLGARVYDPAGAVAAGYLDRVVAEADLVDAAVAEAERLGALRTGAYALTKLNLRGALIEQQLATVKADMDTVDMPKV
ncbi:MAG: crotonase/enoyl-CoA hydratase family protein [Microthrixaceae bacterium]|jgi:enoyl-CoA hydratase|nr:crotonase/enoyl-CoA hydratase family protein [Microthrixaceae bacterium]